jgi:5-methylcytosine-specific restriction endonuclease McrA
MDAGEHIARARRREIVMRPYKRVALTVRKRLERSILQRRRETVYRMLFKKHAGTVPCFVCGKHVPKKDATAEHIIPRSRGGTDDVSNLHISHAKCNSARGNQAP